MNTKERTQRVHWISVTRILHDCHVRQVRWNRRFSGLGDSNTLTTRMAAKWLVDLIDDHRVDTAGTSQRMVIRSEVEQKGVN